MNKVYVVRSGDLFASSSDRLKFFSTEEKARRFITEDCERIRKFCNLKDKGQWDETYADIGIYDYKCGMIKYSYSVKEVL